VVIDERARDGTWCLLPYGKKIDRRGREVWRHPKGCPNWNKKDKCPAHAPHFEDVAIPPYWLVQVPFNLREHHARMREKHPDWSEAQVRCILWWQTGVNARLKRLAKEVRDSLPGKNILLEVPEANGVNLFATCARVGLMLKANPTNVAHKMMIVGGAKPQIVTGHKRKKKGGRRKSREVRSYKRYSKRGLI